MTITQALKYIYPNINLFGDVILQDNGEGVYIAEWNYHLPQPTQEQLLAAEVPAAQQAKILVLKQSCTNAIQAGFTCDALGSAHIYDSELPTDQTNILGAMIASMSGASIPFTCTDVNGHKEQRLHTSTQLQQVFQAAMSHVMVNKTHYDSLKKQVEQATTLEAVNAVNW